MTVAAPIGHQVAVQTIRGPAVPDGCIRTRRPHQLTTAAALGAFVGLALAGWASVLGFSAVAGAAAARPPRSVIQLLSSHWWPPPNLPPKRPLVALAISNRR